MNLFNFFSIYNNSSQNFKKIKILYLNNFLFRTYFFSNYFLLNEHVLQEGLLIDFLQKKITDNWIKKFLIYSSYLFNERLVFDKIIRFYLDLLIWPMHKFFIFEFNNVANTLIITLFFFFLFLFLLIFFYLFLLMF